MMFISYHIHRQFITPSIIIGNLNMTYMNFNKSDNWRKYETMKQILIMIIVVNNILQLKSGWISL